jgi:hypothetical protein
MEVYLYVCDGCAMVRCSTEDNGRNWCVMCQVCRACEFHCKIIVEAKPGEHYTGMMFMLEEKAHDSIGNRKEEQK